MVGLVFVDRLTLTPAQWVALVMVMGLILWREEWQTLLGCHALLLAAFWNRALTTDTHLLFQSASYLSQWPWSAFLSEFPFRDYVKLQPPFYTFWLSCWPSLPLHQYFQANFAVGCGLLMLEIYGDQAKYLLSTPVYLLMSTQPGNDFILFGMVLCVLRLLQLRHRAAAAIGVGVLWLVKPLILIVFPFLCWRVRWWALLSVGILASYLIWSQMYYFGALQWQFLLQQFCLR